MKEILLLPLCFHCGLACSQHTFRLPQSICLSPRVLRNIPNELQQIEISNLSIVAPQVEVTSNEWSQCEASCLSLIALWVEVISPEYVLSVPQHTTGAKDQGRHLHSHIVIQVECVRNMLICNSLFTPDQYLSLGWKI